MSQATFAMLEPEPQFYLHVHKRSEPDQCLVCEYDRDTAEVFIMNVLVTRWVTASKRSQGMIEVTEIMNAHIRK